MASGITKSSLLCSNLTDQRCKEHSCVSFHTFCCDVIAVAPNKGDRMKMKNASNGLLPFTEELEGELSLFSLDGLLPADQAFSVNTECLIISLISTNPTSRNPILLQRLVTEAQMRVLLPLLQSPHYCPHQVLSAS